MPVIICSYCNYVGQCKGKYYSIEEAWQDVVKHEKTCPERIAVEGD